MVGSWTRVQYAVSLFLRNCQVILMKADTRRMFRLVSGTIQTTVPPRPMIAPKDVFAESNPNFAPGDLVRHRKYGYRGVVVALDLSCKASETWYKSNQSQPEKEQPWYHVLVDGAAHTTYAAQTSLEADGSSQCIMHPWIETFFDSFGDGHYMRNDEPWPYGPPQ